LERALLATRDHAVPLALAWQSVLDDAQLIDERCTALSSSSSDRLLRVTSADNFFELSGGGGGGGSSSDDNAPTTATMRADDASTGSDSGDAADDVGDETAATRRYLSAALRSLFMLREAGTVRDALHALPRSSADAALALTGVARALVADAWQRATPLDAPPAGVVDALDGTPNVPVPLALARVAVRGGSASHGVAWRAAWRALGALQPLPWSVMLAGDATSDERIRRRMAACAGRLVFGGAGPLKSASRARLLASSGSMAVAPAVELVRARVCACCGEVSLRAR
jgi:hypothetical protein